MRPSQFLTLLCAGALLAAVAAPHAAAARSSSFTRSFTTPRGTVTQTGTSSFTPSTGAASRTLTTTGPKGETRTVSYSRQPDGSGGFVVTRSLKTFNGKTFTFSHQYGP